MAPTVADALRRATADLAEAGLERPGLEAQLLVAHACGLTRLEALAYAERAPTPEQAEALERLIRARRRRVPQAYLVGEREFYGLPMSVGPGALVPRPETELLVETAFAEIGRTGAARLADLCTGSGCVAVALAQAAPAVRVVATDIAPGALRWAAANAARHGVADRVALVRGSLGAALRPGWAEIIVANPPYVTQSEVCSLQPEVACYEPWCALDGGATGLALLHDLARDAWRALRPGGLLAVEVGAGQSAAARAALGVAGFSDLQALRDLAGVERCVTGRAMARAPHREG